MNTKTQIKTFKDTLSLVNQESNEVFNRNADASITALINRKERCGEKNNNYRKQTQLTCPLPNSNNKRPDNEATVKFAAKQLFQILLVNIKYNHSKSVSDLETLPVLSESNPLIINL